MSLDYVLHEMSYENLIMYGAALPSYGSKNGDQEEVISGDDPQNWEKIKGILFSE